MADTNSQIDCLRDSAGNLDRTAIRSILPYGDEFLFVDKVTKLTAEEVQASYTVPTAAPFIEAHFRGLPLMPGVLIGEGMAQAGTLIVRFNLEDHQNMDILAFQIESARFVGAAQPGDRLDYAVRLVRLRRQLARLEGEVHNQGRRIVRARVELAIVERSKLLEELQSGPAP
jgi:3-hydroxyacyl-[acyl-carrier-protein] dehydratase